MFTIDRVKTDSLAGNRFHDQRSGRHQCLLVSQSDVLACFDRCQGRDETGGTDNRRKGHLRIGVSRTNHQPFDPGKDFSAAPPDHLPQGLCIRLMKNRSNLWSKTTNLGSKKGKIIGAGQSHNLKKFRKVSDNFQATDTDRSGRS